MGLNEEHTMADDEYEGAPDQLAERMAELTGGLKLPPGLNLPL